ncbi:MAG: DegV family protein [Candidatus Neomarinimicrobiota bacterium]
MAINYLDGRRLYRVLHAGLQRVLAREDYLNKINVFPVPDSDTGTNMAYTLTAIQDGIDANDHPDINEMSQKIADSALDGARGNSGVILAQFLVGFAEAIQDKITIGTKQFSQAVENACGRAYEALMEPREGTILTVIREWSEYIHKHHDRVSDFRELLHNGLERAQQSLEDTPNKLEVLKKAGVVDAGAQGFVYLLEGMQEFITKGKIKLYKRQAERRERAQTKSVQAEFDGKYQYCTECTITGNAIDRGELKKRLQGLGDSIVLAGTAAKVKVHIHTDTPQTVFDICQTAGTIVDEKADDMLQQQKDAHAVHGDIAVVMDSACDLPEVLLEKMNIHVVPVKLGFGDEMIVDRVGMTVDEFWAKVAVSPHHPKTSQPSPGDFKRQYQLLANNYRSIISVHIPAGSSGTCQSAIGGAKAVSDCRIEVVDSLNLSVGAGLIALTAGEAIQAGHDLDDVLEITKRAIAKTKIYIGLESLEFAVRGGRVPKAVKTVADIIRMNPILTVGPDGKLSTAGKTFGIRNRPELLLKWTLKKLSKAKKYRFGVAYTTNFYEVEKVAVQLRRLYGAENVLVAQVGPALSVHAGPGTMAIVVQELED